MGVAIKTTLGKKLNINFLFEKPKGKKDSKNIS
jgi:hypothetical protein